MHDGPEPVPAPEDFQWLALPAEMGSLRRFVQFAEEVCARAGLQEDLIDPLELVMEEAVVNVARYAYPAGAGGMVRVGLSPVEHRGIWLRVEDTGAEFNPLTAPAPNLEGTLQEREPGGLGVLLIRATSRECHYQRDGATNRLTAYVEAREQRSQP